MPYSLFIYIILLFMLTVIYPSSINNGQMYHNNAEILGADKSTRPCNGNEPCNCPGGFFIHIDNVPDPKGKCTSCISFKTIQFPEEFTLDSHSQFPVAVSIDWRYDTLNCDSSRIYIIRITKR